MLQIECIEVDGLRAVGTHHCSNALLHSTGEDEPSIVVGMFANEVNSSGRCVNGTNLTIKTVCESSEELLFIHRSYFLHGGSKEGGVAEDVKDISSKT